MNKIILIIFYFALAQGTVSNVRAVPQDIGCDCKALCACYWAACILWPCNDPSNPKGKITALCACKLGGMKHCNNWDSLSKCYCEFPSLSTAQIQVYLKLCNIHDLQTTLGKNYDKVMEKISKAAKKHLKQ